MSLLFTGRGNVTISYIFLSRTPDQIPAYGEIHNGEHGMIAHVSTFSLT